MDLLSLKMILFFMNVIQLTVAQLGITITPAVIEAEITKSLVVKCSFPPQPSNGYQIFSLDLKKYVENSTFVQLASVNRDSHTTVHIDAPSYGISRSSGFISSTQGSFLTVEWLNPRVSESGTYLCKANVFNQADDIIVFNENKVVSFQQPTVSTLIHLIKDLESGLNNKTQTMETGLDFNKLKNESTQNENRLLKLETELGKLKSTLFKISTVYNGRHYYLSLYEPHSAANAEMACEALGGYLAEVDTKNELEFLISLVGRPMGSEIAFLLGGTDEHQEGHWINRHSGTNLGYTSWLAGQPNNSLTFDLRQNCQTLYYYREYLFGMDDQICFNSNLGVKFYFICEVPI